MRQEASLFSLVRAELKTPHTDSQHHPRCSTVSGAPPWDWEKEQETEVELVPTAAAGGDIRGRYICSGRWIKPPKGALYLLIHKVERKTWTPWGRRSMNSHLAQLWPALYSMTRCLEKFPTAVRAMSFVTDSESHLASKLPHLELHSSWPTCHLRTKYKFVC